MGTFSGHPSGHSLATTEDSHTATDKGTVVATGFNDVPEGQTPDVVTGNDTSEQFKMETVRDTIQRLSKGGLLAQGTPIEDVIAGSVKALKGGRLMSVIEFQRAVHAEARCLDDALVRGVIPTGGVLLVTTYPCHLCYKHILSAQIGEVRYIEPYPKSRAEQMYPDASHATLQPYEGTAPSKYNRWFVERAPFLSVVGGTFPTPTQHEMQPNVGVMMKDRDRDAAERLAVSELLETWQ